MKRGNLLFAAALLSAMSASAVSSPFKGSVAGEGTFYLYQVENGTWLQTNRSNLDQWTTYATLNDVGFDVQLIKPENFEGYQIFCRMTNNGSLNGAEQDRFFLDQADRDVTDWIFEPVTVDGVSNAYRIMAKATPEGTDERSAIPADFYMGANGGVLSDNPTEYTWQLVSREERLAKMVADSKNGPVDASWLIPWNDRGRNDMRDREWQMTSTNTQGGGTGFDGSRGYPVQEYWHMCTVRNSVTLTDLPSGTYNFSVQAYYRDTEIESEELAQRFLDGTENLRAIYFAGAAKGTVMSIYAGAKDVQTDGYTYYNEVANKWVPNSMADASVAMINGGYINEYIQTPVSDGTLTIGIEKTEADFRDWLIYKRFFLQYNGEELIGEDLSGLRGELQALIDEALALPGTPSLASAITAAKDALSAAKSSTALLKAIEEFKAYVDGVKGARNEIGYFQEIKAITDAAGINTDAAVEKYNTAVTADNYRNALTEIRYNRRRAAADKHEDVFAGQPVAAGQFYLYNVGQKQFLCGGSDWGAHAALGFHGILFTLEEENAEAGDFHLDTGLYNGAESHYMNYRGYLDCGKAGAWRFLPVAGKENVYNIFQADYPDVHVAWNPYASTDQGQRDETTVGTECRNLDSADTNAQWKLVTAAERDEMLSKASLDNPVDATFHIASPGFNQRENAKDVWMLGNGFNIWEYGANHNDFVAEAWNATEADINQMVTKLPAGIYKVSVQGYYRNGSHAAQADNDPDLSVAWLYAGQNTADDVLLPNITTESGNAPGEGDYTTSEDGLITYRIPNSCVQATEYFKAGLYKTYTVIEVSDGEDTPLGVNKKAGEAEDWVVIDNFRLTYYGKDTTKEAVREALTGIENVMIEEKAEVKGDGRTYNLLGIPVENPTAPGVYIRDGKKIFIR